MKKKISIIITLALITGSLGYYGISCTAADEASCNISVNGISVDKSVRLSSGTKLVPARKVLEALGYSVDYDSYNKKVYVSKQKNTYILTVGSTTVTKGDKELKASAEPQIYDGTVYIPVGIIEDVLGDKVTVDSNSIEIASSYKESKESTNTGSVDLTALTYSGEGISVKDKVVTISEGGEYTLSGTLEGGSVVIDTKDEVKLVLNNVTVTSSDGPAIYFKDCKQGSITLASGSENTLTDSESYSDEDAKGTLFSNDDLVIKGDGTLSINGNYKHALACDDELSIEGGTITINAIADGINANDGVSITGGKVTITAKQDGIQSDGYIELKDGTVDITTTGEVATDNSKDASPMGGGGQGGGKPDGADTGGEQPQMPSGEQPQMPSGEQPQMPSGEQPQMPSGEQPQMPSGEMQQPPEDMQGGEQPQMPTGEQPKEPDNAQDSNKPDKKGGQRGGRPEDMQGGDKADKQNTSDKSEDNSSDGESTEEEYPSTKGIKAETDIIISGGELKVNSTDTALKCEGYVSISGGEVDLTSSKAKGIKSVGTLFITGGSVSTDASNEGIEGKSLMYFNGGNVSVKAKDDGINAGGGSGGVRVSDEEAVEHQIFINGGNVYVNADGDGIDSNGYLTVNGGTLIVDGPTNGGDSALDSGAGYYINGGTVIAAGSNGMLETPENSSDQPSIVVNLDSVQEAGTAIAIEGGGVTIGYKPSKKYQAVIYSSSDVKSGSEYTARVGVTLSGEAVNGIYTSSSADGTEVGTVKAESSVNKIGSAGSNNGGFGGDRGGNGDFGGGDKGFDKGGFAPNNSGSKPSDNKNGSADGNKTEG